MSSAIAIQEAADLVVLATELEPPRRTGPWVTRRRLTQQLERHSRLPLTIVSAPPGFGKTTLLTQWREERPAGTTAWVSLDAAADDPRRLSALVCAALGVDGPFPEEALNRAGAGGDRVLVLDDYHHVTDPACHDRIRFMVEHLPASLRVVIATRWDPPLPLSRLRAGGALGELRAADLRMTLEESQRLVEAHGVSLPPADVRRLQETTEGWAAGLCLAVLSLRGRDDPAAVVDAFAGSHRHVVEYLAAEVLAGEDEETTAFLLRTSILDRMSGAVCDALLGTSGSAATLRGLERRNQLVRALDDDLTWFGYHPLLHDALRFMLAEAHPDEVTGLHMRASAWWEQHGDTERAVDHSLAARDARRAARLVGAHWREVTGARGAAPVPDRWLERLPRAVVLDDPGLCLTRAAVEEARGARRQVVDGWLEAAEGGAGHTRGDGPGDALGTSPIPYGSGSVLLESALVRAAFDGQDVARRLRSAARARRLAATAGPFARSLAATNLAYAQWQAGRHADALATAREATEQADARALPLLGAVQRAIASLAMAALGDEAGADEEARAAFARMRANGHDATPQSTIVWLAHGTACARRGGVDAAVDALRTAAALAEGPNRALDRAHALLALARALKARSDVGPAAEAVREARRIVAGTADPGPLRRLIDASEPGGAAWPADPITEAEMRILRLLPTQLTMRGVAERLLVSHNTVKSHTRVIYRKLDVTSRDEAVVRAREHGLI